MAVSGVRQGNEAASRWPPSVPTGAAAVQTQQWVKTVQGLKTAQEPKAANGDATGAQSLAEGFSEAFRNLPDSVRKKNLRTIEIIVDELTQYNRCIAMADFAEELHTDINFQRSRISSETLQQLDNTKDLEGIRGEMERIIREADGLKNGYGTPPGAPTILAKNCLDLQFNILFENYIKIASSLPDADVESMAELAGRVQGSFKALGLQRSEPARRKSPPTETSPTEARMLINDFDAAFQGLKKSYDTITKFPARAIVADLDQYDRDIANADLKPQLLDEIEALSKRNSPELLKRLADTKDKETIRHEMKRIGEEIRDLTNTYWGPTRLAAACLRLQFDILAKNANSDQAR